LKQERDGGRRDAAKVDAVLVLDTRAIGASARETRLIATCVMPVPMTWLVEAGLGEERLGHVTRERGHIMASMERVYAGVVLQSREAEPEGPLAREAIAKLFLEGRLFKGSLAEAKRRVSERALAAGLAGTRLGDTLGLSPSKPLPPLDVFLAERLLELGVERVADLALLSAEDVLPDALPASREPAAGARVPAARERGRRRVRERGGRGAAPRDAPHGPRSAHHAAARAVHTALRWVQGVRRGRPRAARGARAHAIDSRDGARPEAEAREDRDHPRSGRGGPFSTREIRPYTATCVHASESQPGSWPPS
jgi:hypothetical protein